MTGSARSFSDTPQVTAMRERDAPAGKAGRIAHPSVLVFADFVADHAANGRPADGSNRAASCEDGTSDGPDAGT